MTALILRCSGFETIELNFEHFLLVMLVKEKKVITIFGNVKKAA